METTLDNAFLLTVAIGAVLPALVAFVTNRFASGQVKSLTLLALTAVASVLNPLVGANEFNFNAIATTFVVTFGSAVLSYYGALKPLKIGGEDGAIQTRVPGGIGKVEDEEVEVVEDESDLALDELPGYDEVEGSSEETS
jgi:hypothetical protein